MNGYDEGSLRAQIHKLETELQQTKDKLQRQESASSAESTAYAQNQNGTGVRHPERSLLDSSVHNLMLLSDSALPLGSFAYSSGLESFLAHHKASGTKETNIVLFQKFLKLSIQSIAYTNVPYALAAFRHPGTLAELDNDLDASTPCNVARRASIAQGRALLSVWEKAFLPTIRKNSAETSDTMTGEALKTLESFARELKISSISPNSAVANVNGHIAPLWGIVCLALGLSLADSAYLFLLNHTKAVVSAAVRASVMGPYMAQTVLAGTELQNLITRCIDTVWQLEVEDAGQVVPMLDLWIGRHELLYSRIFNS
jgi:urease accessory protein